MRQEIVHPLKPVVDHRSRILILGSFPSVKSREQGFYYMHPRNRFWPVLSGLTSLDFGGSIDSRIENLLQARIALWDVIGRCTIRGSSDASITDAIPNDIPGLLESAPIGAIFLNGGTAHKLFQQHFSPDIPVYALPSTSPANARKSLPDLLHDWAILQEYL